jgi:F0F1-type ATP synthase epsilon subunit
VLYRPFLVAAMFLEQKQQALISADGAVFRRQLEEAAAMRQTQYALDLAQGAQFTEQQNALDYGLQEITSGASGVGWF